MNLLNYDEEINIAEKYNLSPNEIFLIRALLIAQDEDNLDYFARYMNLPDCVRGNLRDMLLGLQEKGIILKSYKIPAKGSPFEIEDVEFNSNFLKNLYRASFELGSELFDHYPQFCSINGSTVMLRTVSKKYDSLEDAFRVYGKTIRWNPETHQEILNLLDWAKEHDILKCSLASFIVDRRWIDLKALKEGGDNVNYDAIKMI